MKPYLQTSISIAKISSHPILPEVYWSAIGFSPDLMTEQNRFFTPQSNSSERIVIPKTGKYSFIVTGKSSHPFVNCFECILHDGTMDGTSLFHPDDGSLNWPTADTITFESNLEAGDLISFYIGGARYTSGQTEYNSTFDGYLTIMMQ